MVRRLVTFLTLSAAALLGVAARAEAAPAADADLSPDALRAFADDFVATTMDKYRAPGAACVIVKDGRVVYSRGYGVADVRTRVPVDPARTRFPVGSITKLVTATAVMQLVERGDLSLDADVSPLLGTGVSVVNRFDRPVTLRHLLTHTAGFDQGYLGIGVREPALVPPLSRVLAEHRPVCAMRPGDHISYSDDGYLLAAHLLERRSGRQFPAYAREHVLHELGMTRSGFDGDADAAAAAPADRATGYEWDGGVMRVMPPLYVKTVPCAGLSVAPFDLAAFMIAHLGDGSTARADGATRRVLRAETVRLMRERQFGYDPDWDGMTLGFFDRRLGADRRRVLAHGGVGPGVTSNLFLLPDDGVGCFFTFNVYDYRVLELPPEAFARHFFPEPPGRPNASATAVDPRAARRFAGQYRHVAYPRRTIEKVQYLTEQVTVEPGDRIGTLRVSSVVPTEPGPQAFAPSGPARFRQASGDGRAEIGFRTDPATGRVTHLLVGAEAYERLPWAEHPALHRRLFKASAVVFAWAGLAWPVLRLLHAWRLRRRDRLGAAGEARLRRGARADRMLAGGCAINLMFMAGFGFVLVHTSNDAFVCGPPPEMRAMLLLPLMAALLTLAGSARAARLLTDAAAPPLVRLHRAAVAAVAVGFLPLLAYWNLLGFNY